VGQNSRAWGRRGRSGGLSSERLLQQVWDENTDPFTNTVRVTIARLRRKLGEPKIIETTPGVGYRIAGDRNGTEE
jgi:DNA-binding response OmpR family regulator